jgi:Uri superfamily endonuclease
MAGLKGKKRTARHFNHGKSRSPIRTPVDKNLDQAYSCFTMIFTDQAEEEIAKKLEAVRQCKELLFQTFLTVQFVRE